MEKVKDISQLVIKRMNLNCDGESLEQVPEELSDLDWIYFIIYESALEQELLSLNDQNELVFKPDVDVDNTLYKYLVELVSRLAAE